MSVYVHMEYMIRLDAHPIVFFVVCCGIRLSGLRWGGLIRLAQYLTLSV
jgi:hypothetical protein